MMRRQQCYSFSSLCVLSSTSTSSSSSKSNTVSLAIRNNRGGVDSKHCDNNNYRDDNNNVFTGHSIRVSSVTCAPMPLGGCFHEPRGSSNNGLMMIMRMSSSMQHRADGAGAIYACQRRGYLWGQTSLYRSLLTDPRSEVEDVFLEKEPACASLHVPTAGLTSGSSSGTLPANTSVHHSNSRDSPASANPTSACSSSSSSSSVAPEVPTSPRIPRHLLQGVNNMYLTVSYSSSSLSSSSPRRRGGEGNRKKRVERSDEKHTPTTCEKSTLSSIPSTSMSASSNSSLRRVLPSENILRTRVVLCPPAAASTCVVLEPWRVSKGEESVNDAVPKSNINEFYSREHSKDLVKDVFPHLAPQQRCRPPTPTTPTQATTGISHQLYVPTSPADGPQGFLINSEMVRCNGFTDSSQEQILAAFSLFPFPFPPPHVLTNTETDPSGRAGGHIFTNNNSNGNTSGTHNNVKEAEIRVAAAEINVEGVQGDDLGASAVVRRVKVREEIVSLSDFIRVSLVRLLTLEGATTPPVDECTVGKRRGRVGEREKEKEMGCFILRMLQADALTSGIPLNALIEEAKEAVHLLERRGGVDMLRNAETTLSAGGSSSGQAGGGGGGQERGADATNAPSVTHTRVVFSSYRRPFLDFIVVLVQTLESLEDSNTWGDLRSLTISSGGSSSSSSSSSGSRCASEAATRRSIVWCPSSVSPMASLYIADTIREAVLRWRQHSAESATVVQTDTSPSPSFSSATSTYCAEAAHVVGGHNSKDAANGCNEDDNDKKTLVDEDGCQDLQNGELEAFDEKEKGLLSLSVVYGGLPTVNALMRRIVTVVAGEKGDDAPKSEGRTEGPLLPQPGFAVFGVPDSPHSALISWGRSLWLPPSTSSSLSSLSAYHVGDEASMSTQNLCDPMLSHQKRGTNTAQKQGDDADVGVLEAEAADALVLLPPRSTLNHVRDIVRERMERLAGDTAYKTDEGGELTRQKLREEGEEFKRTAALICRSFIGKRNGTAPFGLRRVYVPKSWLFGPPKSLKETSESKGDFSLATKERIEKEDKAEAESVEIVRGAIRKLRSVQMSPISEKKEIPFSLDVEDLKRCISEWERKEALRVYFDCVKGKSRSDAVKKDNAPRATTLQNASPSSSSSPAFPSLFLPSLLDEIKVSYTLGHPLDLKTQLGPLPAADILGRCEEALKTKYASKATSVDHNDRNATGTGTSAPHTPPPLFPPPFTRIVCGGFRPILPAKGGYFFLPSIVSVMEPRITRPPSFKSALLASLSGSIVGESGQHEPPAEPSSYNWHPIGEVPKEGPALLLYPYDDELLFTYDVHEEGEEKDNVNGIDIIHDASLSTETKNVGSGTKPDRWEVGDSQAIDRYDKNTIHAQSTFSSSLSSRSPPATAPKTTIDELVTVPQIVFEHHAYCWSKLTKSS